MRPDVFVIDNYDSFTYNLVQALGKLGANIKVRRNNSTDIAEVEKMDPARILISPGPCDPGKAGVSVEIVRHFAGRKPLLGVCLGHQCIGYSHGAVVTRAGEIMHGKSSLIHHDGRGVLAGLANPFPAIRYHSLAVMREDLPDCLEVTAWTDNGIIMGLRHREYPVEGVQFHPESIMTEVGKDILRNFLGKENPAHD